MFRGIFIWLGWVLVLTLATWLRVQHLTERPIHADEATGARIAAERLEGAGYTFNPKHFHGPLLSAATTPIASLRGESGWSSLSLGTLRIVPVIAGLLCVLTPLLWLKYLSRESALLMAALLASSPLLVYYNRMYIHESLLVLFGLLALNAVYRLATNPNPGAILFSGISIGLMFATKETFAITVIGLMAAYACLLYASYKDGNAADTKAKILNILYVALCAFAVGSFFNSDGFRNMQGVLDAIRTYFVYETGSGHEKGPGHYFHTMLWPKKELGIWWTEGGVALLAVASCVFAIRKERNRKLVLFLTISILLQLGIYSAISYKTPWLMMLPWAQLCVLAGCLATAASRLTRGTKTALLSFVLCILLFQSYQSLQATSRFANDARNPYAYAPTTKDPDRFSNWLRQLEKMQGQPLIPVAVVGQQYWPLPWYLRDFSPVGYWVEPAEEMMQYPVVFAMPSQEAATTAKLKETHIPLPRSLRSNVAIHLYLRNDIWEQWTAQNDK